MMGWCKPVAATSRKAKRQPQSDGEWSLMKLAAVAFPLRSDAVSRILCSCCTVLGKCNVPSCNIANSHDLWLTACATLIGRAIES